MIISLLINIASIFIKILKRTPLIESNEHRINYYISSPLYFLLKRSCCYNVLSAKIDFTVKSKGKTNEYIPTLKKFRFHF